MTASVYSLAFLPSRHFAFNFSVGRKILAELRLWHKTLAASLNRSCTASCYLPKQLSHFSFLRGQLLSLLSTSGAERKFLNPILWACFHMHSRNSPTSSLERPCNKNPWLPLLLCAVQETGVHQEKFAWALNSCVLQQRYVKLINSIT